MNKDKHALGDGRAMSDGTANKNKLWGRGCLVVGGLIALLTACMHLSCIVLGPSCFEAQLAPQSIVQSSIDGTWLAPVGTLAVSTVFTAFTLFAFSRAGLFVRLPMTNIAVVAIASLCIIRGLLTIQLKFRHPELVSQVHLLAGIIWFLTGVLYWAGHRLTGKEKNTKSGG